MGFSLFSEFPKLNQNFLQLLESSEQVEIVGEDGEAVQLPLLLLCLHSDLVCGIVSSIPRHTPVSIYIPAKTEAVQDILNNITMQENKPTPRSLLVFDILGIKINPELEDVEHSSEKTIEKRRIKDENEASFVEEITDDNFIDSQINFTKSEMEFIIEDALELYGGWK